jgi:hypothetical protein
LTSRHAGCRKTEGIRDVAHRTNFDRADGFIQAIDLREFVQDSAPASPTYSPLVERELRFFLAVGVDRARHHDGGIVDGAGDRTRTGKPVKAADFRHTASFEAAVV